MRIRHVGFSAAAWAVLVGAAWGGDSKGTDRPITIIASPATLKVGARCRVELNAVASGRNETVTAYEGVIAKATEQGVGLTVTEEKKTIVRKTAVHVPFKDRLFRNVGIGRPAPGSKKEVWLPSETIHSVELVGKEAPGE
ncbi:MAG: hypothetical protein P4L85_18370 [Paludisphaera borealis]|uniref:hypothetical protein n=1 Tax=Paludisphaera borealis TaxID=1387353 RepID=UPI0028500384|nr:hypothetical protein [Paludisphaera borealis]MDR3621322.1 hypothetical protein [Paludisphaera borealis]